MNKMKILESCEFMTLIRTSEAQDQTQLDCAYNHFLMRVERICKSHRSQIEKLRILTRTHEALERVKSKIADNASPNYQYARSACEILRFEKRTILLQLKYPSLDESKEPRTPPPFNLSKDYTPTDLMEIIITLHAIGFFRMHDTSPVPLSKLTHEFENLCGVKIKNPDNARWAVLNRKIRLTRFIDLLKNTLIELSRK